MSSVFRELYQEMILDHGRHPRNFKALPDANRVQCGHNPLCGDQLTLFVKLAADEATIESLSFEGQGCAICMASASLMTESLQGKTLSEMEALFTQFHQLVTQGKTVEDEADACNLGKLAIFAGVAEYPVRVKCATLPWHTVRAACDTSISHITEEPRPISTE